MLGGLTRGRQDGTSTCQSEKEKKATGVHSALKRCERWRQVMDGRQNGGCYGLGSARDVLVDSLDASDREV